jgi:hypothetical protein
MDVRRLSRVELMLWVRGVTKVMAYLCSFPQKIIVVDISISYVGCNSFLDDQDIKLIGHSIKNILFFFYYVRLDS